jgi:Transglycosylase SLT domain
MANLGDGFYKKLIQMSAELGMKPEDILNVMALESGINPSAHNKNGNASGLVQFMPNTLKNLGFKGSHSDLRNLSGEQQLDWVKKLIQGMMQINGGPFKSAAQYYVGNFLPAALKIPGVKAEDPKTIICAKNPTVPHIPGVSAKFEALCYKQNPVLDVDKDGNISYGDIQTILNRVANSKNFKNALVSLQQSGYSPKNKSDNYEKQFSDRISKMNLNPKSESSKSNINNVLNDFLKQIAASQNFSNYEKFLNHEDFLIKIASDDFSNKVEFARILTSVLKEEKIAKSYCCSNNNEVEVEGKICGKNSLAFEVLNQICDLTKQSFEKITNQKIQFEIKKEKSKFAPIDIKIASQQYRKFLLKFC